MKKPAKIILFYSLVVSVLITTSGVVVALRNGNFINLLLFLPIPFYFLFTFITELKKDGSQDPIITLSSKKITFILISLLLFLAIGFVNVKNGNTTSEEETFPDETLQNPYDENSSSVINFGEIEPTEVPVIPKVEIVLPTNILFVNIRSNATSTSKKIGEAINGETFELISSENNWFEIKFSDETVGWVSKNYAQEVTEKQ